MLRNTRLTLTLAALAATGFLFLGAPQPASAGCGCDHPPPTWAPVMPAFGSPGKTIRVTAADAGYRSGRRYDVTFDVLDSGNQPRTATGTAIDAETLEVEVPMALTAGPAEITVEVPGNQSQTFSSDLFTALAPAPVVSAGGGAFARDRFRGSVTNDGTLLLPLNVRHVMGGMQLAFQFDDLPLEYGVDDVVIYNADGVDLTLFTLAVEGQTEMQWGSYYGWEVEDDTDLTGMSYDAKVTKSSEKENTSDVLTYWRHEFQTYTDAHLTNSSHEVNGIYHADGSLHINHGHLVLAIKGLKHNPNSTASPLAPGKINVHLQVVAVPADDPIEPDVMQDMMEGAASFGDFDPDESHFDEFEGMVASDSQGGSGGKKKK